MILRRGAGRRRARGRAGAGLLSVCLLLCPAGRGADPPAPPQSPGRPLRRGLGGEGRGPGRRALEAAARKAGEGGHNMAQC